MTQDRVVESTWSGRKLDEWLHAEFPEKSKSAWQKEVRRGNVKLDGNRVLRSNVKLMGWFAHDAVQASAETPEDGSANFAILDQIA
ncbi:MAG: hypothetical protein AAF368_06530, partial [Planctomycetota bacterium]